MYNHHVQVYDPGRVVTYMYGVGGHNHWLNNMLTRSDDACDDPVYTCEHFSSTYVYIHVHDKQTSRHFPHKSKPPAGIMYVKMSNANVCSPCMHKAELKSTY